MNAETVRIDPNNPDKSDVYRCCKCGWLEIEDEVPKANDPWTSDGGPLMYCLECGDVDGMSRVDVPDEVYELLLARGDD